MLAVDRTLKVDGKNGAGVERRQQVGHNFRLSEMGLNGGNLKGGIIGRLRSHEGKKRERQKDWEGNHGSKRCGWYEKEKRFNLLGNP